MLCVVVTAARADAEVAADALWSLGVLAVEERDPRGDGSVELWTSLGDDPATATSAAATLGPRWSWRLEEVDSTVVDTWRAHAVPSWVGDDMVVVPAWIPFAAEPGVTVVRIEPSDTFGLGDHPTTRLVAGELRALVRPGASVLDVGCGSGVLAIAACLRGASHATAIDISASAIDVTLANAAANGVGERITATTTPLSGITGSFDIVVANILAPTLVEMAGDLRRVLAPGGVLVASGVLADRHDHVVEALAPLEVVGTATEAGWAAITLLSRAPSAGE